MSIRENLWRRLALFLSRPAVAATLIRTRRSSTCASARATAELTHRAELQ